MHKRLFLFAALIVAITVLGGCGHREYFSKSSYFDGDVVVEYKQSRSRETNDYLTFRFYEKGAYKISFSITPGERGRGKDNVPKNFTKTIDSPPREIVIEQYVLPDFLRVTIDKNGKSESHDFK